MALINCPRCKQSISDKAKKCPHCGKRIKRNKYIVAIIIVILFAIVVVGIYYGVNQYQLKQEKTRQENIESLLQRVDELYARFDFEAIEDCYDKLDKLYYSTTMQREILEYDRKVYKDAYAYYIAINDVNDKLHNGGYTSLQALVEEMKIPTMNFDNLEVNCDSVIGKYINNVKNNVMYSTFNSEYVNGTQYSLDCGLTSSGFRYVIRVYTEHIVKEKFPYVQ